MERRYKVMSILGVRNINSYNETVQKYIDEDIPLIVNLQTGVDPNTNMPIYEKTLVEQEKIPMIVIILDEMADLMLVAGKEVEMYVQRLSQMARAAGIHLIIATQRPSVDVITGVIKSNFPTRISFSVSSKIDSRTIIGEQGAEQLLGKGDMLFMESGKKLARIHGPFVSDEEIARVVSHLKANGNPDYEMIFNLDKDTENTDTNTVENDKKSIMHQDNDLYQEAVSIVLSDQRTSISYVQRQLRIGYNKAANIIERMEKEGVLSAPNSTGRRDIL